MLNREKFAWLVIFIFSVFSITFGILDILSEDYISGIIYLITGIMLFIDTFDVSPYLKTVTFNSFFKKDNEKD